MRADPDLQGQKRSDGKPACHRCALPLMADAEFCPYCERWLDEGGLRRIFGGRGSRRARQSGRLTAASERVMLVVGLALFAFVATLSILAAVAA